MSKLALRAHKHVYYTPSPHAIPSPTCPRFPDHRCRPLSPTVPLCSPTSHLGALSRCCPVSPALIGYDCASRSPCTKANRNKKRFYFPYRNSPKSFVFCGRLNHLCWVTPCGPDLVWDQANRMCNNPWLVGEWDARCWNARARARAHTRTLVRTHAAYNMYTHARRHAVLNVTRTGLYR